VSEQPVVEIDDRGRVSLGRYKPKAGRYLLEVEPNGTLVLIPAKVVSEDQVRLWSNPQLLAELDEARRHPEQMIRGEELHRRRPDLVEPSGVPRRRRPPAAEE
jgi:hypothetical protein